MKHYLFKLLNKQTTIAFNEDNCIVSGFLITDRIRILKTSLFPLTRSKILIHKNYICAFFSLLKSSLIGVSHGFKIILYLKGKGLRIQLKKSTNGSVILYLKLGYSHKLLYKLPTNVWVNLIERRRTLLFFGLNYSILKLLVSKFRKFKPLSLYKLRGFYTATEILKQQKGKSKLSGSLY